MEDKLQCAKCKAMVSKFAYNRHIKCCTGNINNFQGNKKEIITNCPFCNKKFSKYGIHNHIPYCKNNKDRKFKTGTAWNKGLTKETDERVKKSSETYKKHLRNKETKIWITGLTKETDERVKKLSKKVSEGMKKAHKEKRAHNIGKSRWNNEKSYPEKFFITVIENEFIDKNYKTEYPLGIFSGDFVWEHKRKIIEIDGEQHEKEEQKERDKRKNKYMKDNNWTYIRIKWIDLYHNTKYWIKIAKDFIDL